MADAWKGLKILSGQTKTNKTTPPVSVAEQSNFSEELNSFYCRFERPDLDCKLPRVVSDLNERTVDCDVFECDVEAKDVERAFLKLKTKKAVGPDNISARLLKLCASQLCHVFSFLFSWSLKDCCVPNLWKKSVIAPIPKNSKPASLNDYRPVALTPIVMKCFERIVLTRLLSHTSKHHDPSQFAYKPHRNTDDAILTLLHNAYTHLEKPGSFVRILFVDFSSAFNTIQPHLMALKLLSYDVHPKLILWIVSFLVNRSQSVRFQNALSSTTSTSTGSPQGTVLSPFLFTLYTNDCTGTDTTPLIKYSDDSALEDLSNSDAIYFDEVKKFSTWCKDNYLDLNVKKTKEMLIDFRKNPTPVPDLLIDGVKVERVNAYRYLGTVLDEKLTLTTNTDYINKKCQSRIYCLQKLRNLRVKASVLQDFYRCFIESVLTFSFICWYRGLNVRSKNVLERVVNVCGKVVEMRQESLNELYEKRVRKKAWTIRTDQSHVLAHMYELLPSGRRFRAPKCKTVRSRDSFIPASIRILNK
jgi:hypothetical protein